MKERIPFFIGHAMGHPEINPLACSVLLMATSNDWTERCREITGVVPQTTSWRCISRHTLLNIKCGVRYEDLAWVGHVARLPYHAARQAKHEPPQWFNGLADYMLTRESNSAARIMPVRVYNSVLWFEVTVRPQTISRMCLITFPGGASGWWLRKSRCLSGDAGGMDGSARIQACRRGRSCYWTLKTRGQKSWWY